MFEKMLDGKVAIITGAGRGIGAATARLMAEAGARLVLADLDEQPLGDFATELRSTGSQVATLTGDVTGEDLPAQVLDLAQSSFGTPDILVNNAGFTWDAMLHKMQPKQWDTILAVHLTAPFRLTQVVGGAMRDAGKTELETAGQARPRKIVNVSSISGTDGNVGQANYSAAKSGLIGLTKTTAKEWGRFNICANAVAFGWIETRLTADKSAGGAITHSGETIALGIPLQQFEMSKLLIALGRPGTVTEAASAIFFLCSPLANYVSAQTLVVDGGR